METTRPTSDSSVRSRTARAPDGEPTKINWRPWVVACCRGLNVHVFIIYFFYWKGPSDIYVTRPLFIARPPRILSLPWPPPDPGDAIEHLYYSRGNHSSKSNALHNRFLICSGTDLKNALSLQAGKRNNSWWQTVLDRCGRYQVSFFAYYSETGHNFSAKLPVGFTPKGTGVIHYNEKTEITISWSCQYRLQTPQTKWCHCNLSLFLLPTVFLELRYTKAVSNAPRAQGTRWSK